MVTVKLQSSDNEILTTDLSIVQCSATIMNLLTDCAADGVIPLNINAAILNKVLHWANYHKDDPPAVNHVNTDKYANPITDDISDWDADFMKVDQGTLFSLMSAAKYLNIRGLTDLTCKTIANSIKGKTPGEMREFFRLRMDFDETEDEKEEYEQKLANTFAK